MKSVEMQSARLRGILFLPCIQWTIMNIRVHSCPFVSIRDSFYLRNDLRSRSVIREDFKQQRMP